MYILTLVFVKTNVKLHSQHQLLTDVVVEHTTLVFFTKNQCRLSDNNINFY